LKAKYKKQAFFYFQINLYVLDGIEKNKTHLPNNSQPQKNTIKACNTISTRHGYFKHHSLVEKQKFKSKKNKNKLKVTADLLFFSFI
jgi:hypothetical protein